MDMKKRTIAQIYCIICKIQSHQSGYSFPDYSISFTTQNMFELGNVEIKEYVKTTVDGKSYVDVLPKNGGRRDRKALAKVVCGHICDNWNVAFEECKDWIDVFLGKADYEKEKELTELDEMQQAFEEYNSKFNF